MGRYLEQYDKDYMRMAMLKQEETFKHQVTELHRLYRVQKLLMNDMKVERRRQRNSCSSSRTRLERWNRSTDSETLASSRQPGYEHGCRDQRRNRGGLDQEEECGLELTLATGGRSGRKKESSFASDSGASFSSSSTGRSGAGAKFSGSEWGVVKQQPPWLFHCSSLNMT
ncbi:uncharacterized protein M6B38_137665 [Iris pallida]|uniref:Uncharacterized protein n=1 Tax=Iris pallida TaxID=29817 RepID=A0AAX6FEG0_IRIPA|nr:uncharacterized protein M6B38_137665 [Iris pallida]